MDFASEAPDTPSYYASDLLRGLRRRWPLIIVGALIGALAGWLYGSQGTDSFRATAVVEVRNGQGTEQDAINTATERQVALSGSVIGRVLEDTGSQGSIGAFRSRAEVDSPPNSTTLSFSVTNADPEQAALEAETWAEEYLSFRASEASDTIERAISRIDTTLDDVRSRLAESEQELAAAPANSAQQQEAQAAQQLFEAQIVALIQRRVALEASDVDQGRILSSPEVPGRAEGFGALPYSLAGAMLGGLAGLLLTIALSRPQRALRAVDDLPQALQQWTTTDFSQPTLGGGFDALVERIRRLPEATDSWGVVLVGLSPESIQVSNLVSAALKRRGINAEVVTERDAFAYLSSEARPQVLVSSADQQDPWFSLLAGSAQLVLVVATVRRTTVAQATRAMKVAVEATGAAHLVLVSLTEDSARMSSDGGDLPANRPASDGAEARPDKGSSHEPATGLADPPSSAERQAGDNPANESMGQHARNRG